MPFDFALSKELEETVEKLKKKDKRRLEILYKKINRILDSTGEEIAHFKNLRYGLSDRQRVHVDKSFVLTFKVDLEKNFIFFIDFKHHDLIYKRK